MCVLNDWYKWKKPITKKKSLVSLLICLLKDLLSLWLGYILFYILFILRKRQMCWILVWRFINQNLKKWMLFFFLFVEKMLIFFSQAAKVYTECSLYSLWKGEKKRHPEGEKCRERGMPKKLADWIKSPVWKAKKKSLFIIYQILFLCFSCAYNVWFLSKEKARLR